MQSKRTRKPNIPYVEYTEKELRQLMRKSKPGEFIGWDKQGEEVWNDDSESDGEPLPKAQQPGPKEQQPDPKEQRPAVTLVEKIRDDDETSDEEPEPAKAGKAKEGEKRLRFDFGDLRCERRSIELMKCFVDEGEALFTHGCAGKAMERIAELCNGDQLFQINGVGALTVSTLKKKLKDWLDMWGPGGGAHSEESSTGSGGGAGRSSNLRDMDKLMETIIANETAVKSRKGAKKRSKDGAKGRDGAATLDEALEKAKATAKKRKRRDASDDGEDELEDDDGADKENGRQNKGGRPKEGGPSRRNAGGGVIGGIANAASAMGEAFKAMAPKPPPTPTDAELEIRKQDAEAKRNLDSRKLDLRERRELAQAEQAKQQFTLLRDEMSLRQQEAENEKLRLQIELEKLRSK